jgi:hypothetical protein
MPELDNVLAKALAERYSTNLVRIRELAAPLTEQQF